MLRSVDRGRAVFQTLLPRPILRRVVALAVVVVWTGLILYPNPVPLVVSFQRSFKPPADAAAVRDIAASLPDDPAAVEAFSEGFLTYQTAWELYGQFWYFPVVSEVVANRAGDCQSEALLTASILSAKGIPYTLRYSLTHAWVDYEGKGLNELEDPALAVASDAGGGWLGGLPQRWPIRETIDQLTAYHWTPMPLERKVLIWLGAMTALALAEGPLLVRCGRAGWRCLRRLWVAPVHSTAKDGHGA